MPEVAAWRARARELPIFDLPASAKTPANTISDGRERDDERQRAAKPAGFFSFLDRAHTVAEPGFSRWMVPPAALCIHLCIGQAYAFSVFNLPMSKLIGIDHAAPDDWKLTDLGWIFSIAIFFLGASAAVFGRWVEDGGPRRAMFASGLCWAGGFFVSARSASICTRCGSSISATACSAASGSGSAISRRSRP